MGRGKVQLKRIEDKNSRQVTFSKRRTGLIKKARELSILCDVEIALIVFSARGKLYQFCTGDSLRKVLERYQIHKDAEVAGSSVQESKKLTGGYMDFSRGTNLLQMVQRHFEEQKIEQLDVAELTQVQHQLDAILRQTRIKKSQLMMKAVTALHEKGGVSQPPRIPSQPHTQQGSSFTLQLFRRTLEETLGSFQKSIHEDMRNLHIEILRRFHMQEMEMSGVMSSILENQAEIMKEVQSLRKETQQLRQLL